MPRLSFSMVLWAAGGKKEETMVECICGECAWCRVKANDNKRVRGLENRIDELTAYVKLLEFELRQANPKAFKNITDYAKARGYSATG